MKRIDYLLLFTIQVVVLILVGGFQAAPGYMDADYYYAGGINLMAGGGAKDRFLWNYLDDPVQLPHPSFTYWMPLPSVIASLGMIFTGSRDFNSARLFFLVLAGIIPILSALISFSFTKTRVGGWLAGGLVVFSGYYLAYLGLVETFAPTMVFTTLILMLVAANPNKWFQLALAGGLAGLLHLTRADGILWAAAGLAGIVVQAVRRNPVKLRYLVLGAGAFAGGYLAVMGGWYARNLSEFGSLFPPGNSRALWLVEYNQLFSYPASVLNFSNWFGAGVGMLIQQRWEALLLNLQTVLAVQGEIFLLPLALIGGWTLRKNVIVRSGFMAWSAYFLLMTFVFPLAGSRGGFFHSAAGLQPLIWGLCPVGLIQLIQVGIRKRGWMLKRALPGFSLLLVVVAALLSAGITAVRIFNLDTGENTWQESWEIYREVDRELVRLGAERQAIVVVNNPPGYFVATGRSAIVIPNGGEEDTLAAARTFGADFLILEENTVEGLTQLYLNPENRNNLIHLATIESTQIFRILR